MFKLLRGRSIFLTGMAVFVAFWVLARAAVQAITIDEADTYLAFVAPAWPSYWYPASNNHVL